MSDFVEATKCLYLADSYVFEGDGATSLSVCKLAEEAVERKWGTHSLVLDGTLFHAQGGGQPADRGHIILSREDGVPVTFEVNMVKMMEGGGDHALGEISRRRRRRRGGGRGMSARGQKSEHACK